jgi:hypothetical protein
MIAENCSICMDNDDPDSRILLTPCGYGFHSMCLKSLIRPKCPLCNKNIMIFLVKNGVAKDDILKKIISDDYRIVHEGFVRENTLDTMDHDDIMMTIILAKKET